MHSLVPFNPKFHDISHTKPDLYGPFWIYTTLIFVIAASGSLTKYLENDRSQDFFQLYVPKAASMVYIISKYEYEYIFRYMVLDLFFRLFSRFL